VKERVKESICEHEIERKKGAHTIRANGAIKIQHAQNPKRARIVRDFIPFYILDGWMDVAKRKHEEKLPVNA
jgi:hypothetical protein